MSINPPKTQTTNDDKNENDFEEYGDDDEEPRLIPEIEDCTDANGRLLDQQPTYDKLINAEVLLQQADSRVSGKVKRRALGPDGTTTGTYDDNPQCNTVIYEVEFPDGEVKEYLANIIAENILL